MNSPKQQVDLKQQQQLTLTPQLKQSLHILMLNQAELEEEIELMLEKNVMLERLDNEADNAKYEDESNGFDELAGDIELSEISQTSLPEELEFDANWQDFFEPESSYETSGSDEGFQFERVGDICSFDEQLETALLQAGFSDKQQMMVEAVLKHLDENYFLSGIEPAMLAKKIKVSLEDLMQVINIIRHLDPPGVASKNIAECMLAKLHVLNNCQEAHINAHEIIENYLPYLGQKDELIKQRLAITDTEFTEALFVIRELSPYPFERNLVSAQTIKPDIYVRKKMGFFYASMNLDKRFDVAINEEYAALSKQALGDDKTFITAQLQEAKWFIQALDKRQKTVLRVANAIVMHQQDFFVDGEVAIKPMDMAVIAEQLEVNESTVSRAVNGKYLSFNHQLYELKFFFSQQIGKSESGESISSTSAKALIKTLIEAENSQKPLSDLAIEETLKSKGIDIARRTVAKYRESLGFVSSSKRKRKK